MGCHAATSPARPLPARTGPAHAAQVTSNRALARRCSAHFALYVMLLPKPLAHRAALFLALKDALRFAVSEGLCVPGKEVAVLASTEATLEERAAERELFVTVAPGTLQFDKLGSLAPHVESPSSSARDAAFVAKCISLRAASISLSTILRKSKVRCEQSAGPGARACEWSTSNAAGLAGAATQR